ncbi:MAG: MaoC family dehydratase N-terminal domain-containing protein, partial [Oscillospiraceae bacterium]|nr:MaoC family dehydratase N-terminal domain-containing protein [Oscillospiraceae bacterium]
MFSTLAGVYLPGEHCLLHSVETKFSSPVFPGDTLTVTGKISEINDTFKTLTIKGHITNQDGKKVCKAVIQAGVRE